MSVSIQILFVLTIVAHTGFALECELCTEGKCVGSRNCDYLPLIRVDDKLMCFIYEAKNMKGCTASQACNQTGFECCETDNCNSAPFLSMTTTLNPLDFEFPMSCMVCSGSTCLGSMSCSYLPVINKEWGKKVCFTSKVYDMKACVQEAGCSDKNIDCCYTEDCNAK